ncbi:MAG: hypothetical protein ABI480_01910 [Chitinophagaceae bacterium]
MDQEEIFRGVAQQLEIQVQDNQSAARQLLVDRINNLLQYDFNKLIAILYRVDVSDQKLQSLLNQQPQQDAANIIADLLIERQIQKIKSRNEFTQKNDASDDEKW